MTEPDQRNEAIATGRSCFHSLESSKSHEHIDARTRRVHKEPARVNIFNLRYASTPGEFFFCDYLPGGLISGTDWKYKATGGLGRVPPFCCATNVAHNARNLLAWPLDHNLKENRGFNGLIAHRARREAIPADRREHILIEISAA
jgi:hypothetical protein